MGRPAEPVAFMTRRAAMEWVTKNTHNTLWTAEGETVRIDGGGMVWILKERKHHPGEEPPSFAWYPMRRSE